MKMASRMNAWCMVLACGLASVFLETATDASAPKHVEICILSSPLVANLCIHLANGFTFAN